MPLYLHSCASCAFRVASSEILRQACRSECLSSVCNLSRIVFHALFEHCLPGHFPGTVDSEKMSAPCCEFSIPRRPFSRVAPLNAWLLPLALSPCGSQLLLIHQHPVPTARHGQLHLRRHPTAIPACPCTSSAVPASSSCPSTVLGAIPDSKVPPTGDTEHNFVRPGLLSAQITKSQQRAPPFT